MESICSTCCNFACEFNALVHRENCELYVSPEQAIQQLLDDYSSSGSGSGVGETICPSVSIMRVFPFASDSVTVDI